MELWYRRQFNLAANDPRFLGLTQLDILTEYFAHHYDDLKRQGKSIEEYEDPDFDAEAARFMDDDNPDNWEEA